MTSPVTMSTLEITGIAVTHVANDAVYDFVVAVTVGHEDVEEIAHALSARDLLISAFIRIR